MKNINTTITILLVFLSSISTYSQTNLHDILDDYNKNPERSIEKYLNKTTTIIRVKINGIYYRKQPDGSKKPILNCVWGKLDNIEIEDLNYTDVLKLNNHDSVIIRGLFSSRGTVGKGYWFTHVLLKKSQLIEIIEKDEIWINQITNQYKCESCSTDLKKYNEYIIEDIINAVRSEKTCLNKTLTLDVAIKEFYKSGIINYIKVGGFGGNVTENKLKYRIVIYGIEKGDYLKLNVGDTIHIRGTLVQTDLGRFAKNEYNSYELITLSKCTLIKK